MLPEPRLLLALAAGAAWHCSAVHVRTGAAAMTTVSVTANISATPRVVPAAFDSLIM
eukprot:SAG22_NODE_1327_length_4730_cov_3.576549_7_plen_57_part_00